jgi:AcrR family transcriptional regulator
MIFRQAAPRETSANGGRVAQKQRTRLQLLQAARELRASGRVPTVADVADATGISRTTAYRYFPTQETLLAEASADPLIEAVTLAVRRAGNCTDVVDRVDAVFAELLPVLLRHEAELRTLLKISLENSLEETHRRHIPILSATWVMAWDGILEPLRQRVAPRRYALMVRALGTLLSIEALNVVRDACDLDEAATMEAVRFAARSMVRGFCMTLTEGDSL